MKHKKTRIRSANKHLQCFLQDNDKFYVGLLFEDFLKSESLKKYDLPTTFKEFETVIPKGIGSVSKSNIKGKYIRKQPEEKTDKLVHISYFRSKDGAYISYDRIFFVYVKELAHKYNLDIHFLTNKNGQQVVVSEMLTYDNNPENEIKNTHAMNLFYEIFNDCEVFDKDLNPAIHFNKRFETDLLPQGQLSEERVYDDLMHYAKRSLKDDEEKKAFQKRLHILMKYAPDLRGKGPIGFKGYLVFGFSELGIVIVETMLANNATYIFKPQNYENIVTKDKQSILTGKLMEKRFFHHQDWEQQITKYLNGLKQVG